MNFRKIQQIALFAAVASTTLLVSCDRTELAEMQVKEEIANKPVTGQYIVVFKSEASVQAANLSATTTQHQVTAPLTLQHQLLSDLRIAPTAVRETLRGITPGFVAELTSEQVALLLKRPEIAYLEQDRYITLAKPKQELGKITRSLIPVKPIDTQLPYKTFTPLSGEHIPWSIEQVGYGDGSGKNVWIIDSGVDVQHPDLTVDEARSKSFLYGITSVQDGFGHGTKVAGIIAAKNNGSGMIGVAANATVVALRVFDDAGQGSTAKVISAVNYAVANGKPGDVINISLGGGVSSTLDNAVRTAASKGFIFSIAAGNTSVDCSSVSPARADAPNIYTISAVDNFNQLWENSNFGASVDFAAPGVNITTTKLYGGLSTGNNGTSFAAPHVAGILLLRSDVIAKATVTGDKDTYPERVASAR